MMISADKPFWARDNSELNVLTRSVDWTRTSLGPVASWPHNLHTTLGILLNAGYPMFLFWGKDLLCFYNDAFRHYLGNNGKHPCVGRPGREIWPETWPVIGPQISQVFTNGESTFFKDQLLSIYRNGRQEASNWTYSCSPVLGDDGSVEGALVTCIETTDAVHNDDKMSKSADHYRALVTTTSDVVYRMNADWSELLELGGKGLLADTSHSNRRWMAQYIPPEDHSRLSVLISHAVARQETFEFEHRVLRADGTAGWVFSRANPIKGRDGRIVEWFGAAGDITSRKKIEEELRLAGDSMGRSQRLYETITDNTPDLIYVFTPDYRFSYANKALLSMWGKTWEESIGQGLRALGYEEWHAAMHEREIDQIIATRQPVRGTVTFPHAELGTRYYDYILTPVIGAGGEVEAIAGTTRDVTDFKYAEAALRESEERYRNLAESLEIKVGERTGELTRSNEDLQQFAHVASHDLKEPVRKILTFANMLDSSDGAGLSGPGRISLSKIRNSADRMMNMISGVLAYSRLSALEQPREPIDLNEIMAQVETDLELMIRQKRAVIAKDSLPVISGEQLRIHQLFYNLINNAVKFGKKDAPVIIRVAGQSAADGWVNITVKDNGIGFEPEYAAGIFKPFRRLHSKDTYEGTGLGLALCKRIVERYGGTIEAVGTPGEGAAFSMTLPAWKAEDGG